MVLCPNKKSLEILQPIPPECLEVSNKSRGKDSGNSPVLPSGWFNKRHNRELLISSVLTFFSIYWIAFQGIKLKDGTLISGLLSKTKNSSNKILKNRRFPKMRVTLPILSLIIELYWENENNKIVPIYGFHIPEIYIENAGVE